jgi:predicted outer membrane protein
MNTRTPILLAMAALLPLAGYAKSSSKKGGGQGLPPKFGGLIQPAPEGAGESRTGLITSELAGRDLEFLMNMIELGRLQSWLVNLAQQRGETPEVKSIGGALLEIQGQENSFVEKLAASKGVAVGGGSVPGDPQKKLAAQFKPLSGPKLEKAVIDQIVTAAQESVSQYEAALRSQDAEIKRLAEQMLPAAKSRLQFASKASGRAQDTNVKPTFRTGTVDAPAAAGAGEPREAGAPRNAPAKPPRPTPVPGGTSAPTGPASPTRATRPDAIAAPPAPAPRAGGPASGAAGGTTSTAPGATAPATPPAAPNAAPAQTTPRAMAPARGNATPAPAK